MRLIRKLLLLAAALAVATSAMPPPAHAIHLFPLTPVFDPLGHDCAKGLTAAPASAAGEVSVVGFNFVDGASGTTTTRINAGQNVAWTWLADHCHSVTFNNGSGTNGAAGFQPAQPQLVRMNGLGNDTFSLSFLTAGTYFYSCVHHASVGMTGVVVVT